MPFFKTASSLRSDSSDVDLDGLVEGELAKLQRQFRLLEGDRHAYALESREIIRRQMVEVKRLEKENAELLRRQLVAQSRSNQKRGKAQTASLRSLLHQRDSVEEEIVKEKKRIAQLDQEIRTWQKRLGDQKLLGSGSMIQERKAQLQRKIQTLENQLDKAASQFDCQLIVNSKLREDLEILQIGHDRFEHVYRHLEKELLDTRKTIGAVISTSTTAYEARDESRTRLIQLKDKAVKELAQHEIEIKELCRTLEHDRRIRDFIAIKLQERMLTEEALKAKRKQEQERKQRDPEQELLGSYQATFKKVLELTGAKHLDDVLDKFVEDEERNFAEFNFVNEQNNQKERLWEQITNLCREIEEVRVQESQKESKQLAQLKVAEAKQDAVVKEGEQAQLTLKAHAKIWEQLKSGIESLFEKLQCDRSMLEKILGGSSALRDENIAIYLASIERKTNSLLAMYAYVTAEEQDKPYDTLETVQLLLGQKPEVPHSPPHLRPPTAGLGHEPIAEEDQRPLTHTELKERILKDIRNKSDHKKSVQNDEPSTHGGAVGYKGQSLTS